MRIATITNWAYGVTTCLAVVAGTALFFASGADLRERAAVEQRFRLDALSEEIEVDNLELTDLARMFVVTGNDTYRQSFDNRFRQVESIERKLAAVQDAGAGEVELLALGDALRSVQALQSEQRTAVDMAVEGDGDAARALLFGPAYMQDLAQAESQMARFQYLMDQRVEATVAEATRMAHRLRRMSEVMVGMTAILFVFVMGFILKQRILQPVVRLSDVVNRLAAQDYDVEPPKSSQIDEIGDIAQAIGIFRENGLARQRLERQRDADWAVRDLLSRMTQRLHGCETLDDMVQVVSLFAPKIAPDLSGTLYIRDGVSERMVCIARWPDDQGPAPSLDFDECWALRRGHLHRPGGEMPDIPCRHLPVELAGSAICVPLAAQSETTGLLTFHAAGSTASHAIEAYLEMMAETVGMTLANLNLRARLHEMALSDPLTGLLNRHQLDHILQRVGREAAAQNEPFGCIMLDIDRFKSINDRFGHTAGDTVIRAVSDAIKVMIRPSDYAFRVGGEEFLIIIPGMADAQVQARADTLRENIKALILSDHTQMLSPVTVSAGVATFPRHGSPEAVVQAADSALFLAKQTGRDRVILAAIA